MRRLEAAAGSAVFLLVAPGVVAGLVPWLLTGWDSTDPPAIVELLGGVLIVAGAAVLIRAFARFVLEGGGTPAPVAPTERLVVGGLYRYVRNPMYVAVGATIVGQALLLGRPALLAYAALFWLVVAAFVHGGCCAKDAARLVGCELSAGFVSGGKAPTARQAAAGAVVWRQSLRRLCAALVSRHSDRAAARPRRKKRSTPRLNLMSANTGSIMPWRLA